MKCQVLSEKKMINNVGDNLTWFIGVVEDRDDPLKCGRVRVRCFSIHTQDKTLLPTVDLPWAQLIQDPSSAASGNVGKTPLGLLVGSWVMGFFMDGNDCQQPIIMGSIAGFNNDIPDVNQLARGDNSHPVISDKNSNIHSATIAFGGSWSEPYSAYAAEYPYNKVNESESGHIKEIDDTPGSERIHDYHKSGTFTEVDANGNKSTRVTGENFEVVVGNDNILVVGDCNITVEGTARIKAPAIKIETDDLDIKTGTYNLQITGETHERYEGDKYIHIGADTVQRHDEGVDYTCPFDPPRYSGQYCVDVEEAE